MIAQYKKCVDFFMRRFFNKVTAKCWIAGGALRDYYTTGYTTTDLDVYFPNEKELLIAMKELIQAGYNIDYESENSVKLSRGKDQIDLVKVYFSTPAETFETFDFTCVCCVVSPDGVWHHPTFFIDLASKKLVINKLWKPLGTLKRLQKYAKKGYNMENDQLLVLALSIQECDDFDNYDVDDQRKIAQGMSVGVNAEGNVVPADYKDKEFKKGNQKVLSEIQEYPKTEPVKPEKGKGKKKGKAEADPFVNAPVEVQEMLDEAGVNADTVAPIDGQGSYFSAFVTDEGRVQTNFQEFVNAYGIFDAGSENRHLLAKWNQEKSAWYLAQIDKHLEARERGEVTSDRLTGPTTFQMNSFDPVIQDEVPEQFRKGSINETAALVKRKLAEQRQSKAYKSDTSTPMPAPDSRCTEALMQEQPSIADKLSKRFDAYPAQEEVSSGKKSKKDKKNKKKRKNLSGLMD